MRFTLVFALLLNSFLAQAQPDTLPLMNICNMQYEGAFRVSAGTFGESSLNYSNGSMAYNPANNSLFIVGHAHHQAIAEFAIPALSTATNIEDLNMVETPLQDFHSIIPDGDDNPDALDAIGGMTLFEGATGPELLINCYEYYDAAGTNTETSIVITNPDDLANMTSVGFYETNQAPGHVCGWVSPVPAALQDTIGGKNIAGSGVGLPIISRLSVGPSAFAFNPEDYTTSNPETDIISMTTMMDFSLGNPMHDSTLSNYNSVGDWLYNDSLDNNMMTYVSNMEYGFIVPGTRTYLVLGRSGGHESGVCYKCTQDDGNLCGGYCTPVAADNYHYYWSFDLLDLLAAKNGDIAAHEIQPYAYGKLALPFDDNGAAELGGAAFDEASGTLYLCLNKGDLEQGTYARPPLILAYSFAEPVSPVAICKDVTMNLDQQATIQLFPSVIDDGSIYNCENEIRVLPESLNCEALGITTTAHLLIKDLDGNTSSCLSEITVQDLAQANSRQVISAEDIILGSLRQIVNDACLNDTIRFDMTLLNDTIQLIDSSINLSDKNLVIEGLGIDQLYISGNFENLVFYLPAGQLATISNLNVIDGHAPNSNAGGIENHGTLRLENVKFSSNTNMNGSAAITNQSNGQLIISGEIIIEN